MKPNKILLYVVFGIAAWTGFYYVFWPDLSKYLHMRRQNGFLDQRIAEEQRKSQYLKKEQEGLSGDPVQIERVAREKLGLSRPKDLIYKFEDSQAAQQSTSAPPAPAKAKN